jgi:hypothetical protein
MLGAARPTDATANNAITVLRNIAILRQTYRSSTLIAGGNHSGETLLALTSLLLNSARESKFKFSQRVVRAPLLT